MINQVVIMIMKTKKMWCWNVICANALLFLSAKNIFWNSWKHSSVYFNENQPWLPKASHRYASSCPTEKNLKKFQGFRRICLVPLKWIPAHCGSITLGGFWSSSCWRKGICGKQEVLTTFICSSILNIYSIQNVWLFKSSCLFQTYALGDRGLNGKTRKQHGQITT